MAISVTSIGFGFSSTGTTCAITVGAGGVPAGAMIALIFHDRSTTAASSVADSKSNSYSNAMQVARNGSSTNGFGGIFYASNVTALVSGDTITHTRPQSATKVAISALYATGIATIDASDGPSQASSSGSTTTPSVTSGTPSVAGELFIAFIAPAGNSNYTQDTTNGWSSNFTGTKTGATTTDAKIEGGTFVNTGTGTVTYAPTLSVASGASWGVAGFKPAASSTSYSLPASSGSYALTGNSPALSRGWRLAASTASYTESAFAAALNRARTVSATGSYTESGVSAALNKALRLTPPTGTYAWTRNPVGTSWARRMTASTRSYVLTGNPATINRSRLMTANTASFVITGQPVSWIKGKLLVPSTGTFVVSGSAALNSVRSLRVTAASFVITRNPATVGRLVLLTPTTGAFVITRSPVSFLRTLLMSSVAGTYVESGNPAVLRVVSSHYTGNTPAIMVGV